MNINSLIRYFESVPENTEITFMSLTKYIGVASANGNKYMATLEDLGIVELIRIERNKLKGIKQRYTEIYTETELGKQLRPLIIKMGEATHIR